VAQSVKNIPAPLLPREAQVVPALAQGQPVQAVAKLLGISANTVWSLLYQAVRKLGISSRAELTCAAIRLGYIPCPCSKRTVKSEVG
jgi:DNA-binding NarL/FixJ family response regulator